MDSDWIASKITVLNLQIHQSFLGQRSLKVWQYILLGVSLASGSISATAADAAQPELQPNFPDAPQLAPEASEPAPHPSQPLLNARATALTAGLQVPTVETTLNWSDAQWSTSLGVTQAQRFTSSSQELLVQSSLPSALLEPSFSPALSTDAPSKLETNSKAVAGSQEGEEPSSEEESSTNSAEADPELGELRLRPETEGSERSPEVSQALDPELGNLRLQERLDHSPGSVDSELGNLRLRQQVAKAPPQPSVYLQGRFDYFNSDNIFSEVNPIQDSLIRSGLTLWAAPKVGSNTYVIASASGNLIRYTNLDDFNYNELLLGASIYQQLSPRMYGEIGWTNQQLFSLFNGDRFLNDHSFRLALGRRDPLGQSFALQSFYQLRLSFADPDERSRVINNVGASLIYNATQRWQASLDYQYILSNFTKQDQQDDYHQLLGALTYRPSRSTQLTLFGGFSFGGSSKPNIDFDSSLLGVSLFFNLPLF